MWFPEAAKLFGVLKTNPAVIGLKVQTPWALLGKPLQTIVFDFIVCNIVKISHLFDDG